MRSPGAVAARRASVSKARRWTSRAPGFQWDEALKIVQRAEDTFNRGDVDAILNRYAEDVIIRYAGLLEIWGRVSAERFLRARFARQNNYRLKKTLFMVEGLQDRGHLFRVLGRCADRLGDARAGR